jgi:hypothetical protein
MGMSATAMDLCAVEGEWRRFLRSPLLVGILLITLASVLGFEITSAIADASVSPGAAPLSLPNVVRPPVFHHMVPPIPVPIETTMAIIPAKPVTTVVAPKPPAHAVRTFTTPTVPRAAATSAPRPVAKTPKAASPIASSYGGGAAISYLSAHAAPGFTFECPGYALGHQAMTCINVAGVCAGSHLIVISDPCQAAYENEASNSWVLEGLRHAPIDPYGYCH